MASKSMKRSHAVYLVSDDDTDTKSATSQPKRPKTKRIPLREGLGLQDMITALPAEKTNDLLFQLAQRGPSVAFIRARVQELVDEELAVKAAARRPRAHAKAAADATAGRAKAHTKAAAEAAKEAAKPPVNFDSYSKTCWHALNTEHKRLKSSKQFEAAFEVFDVLHSTKDKIMSLAQKGTRWETRRNALEVLRKITKSIILCELQVIRHELLKDGLLLREFAESMLELAMGMNKLEKQRYKDEGLYEKLQELQDEDGDIEGLEDVYAVFDNES